jgi:hypothetical protein
LSKNLIKAEKVTVAELEKDNDIRVDDSREFQQKRFK